MRKPVVLITGAGGEIGHALVARLAASGHAIITLDVNPLDPTLAPLVAREFTGSITDASLLDRDPRRVRGRLRVPPGRAAVDARRVHAGHRAPRQRRGHAEPARVRAEAGRIARPAGRASSTPRRSRPTACRTSRPRRAAGRVREDEYPHPTTMYGCNKLYCEELGRYYARHYKQLSVDVDAARRLPRVRFPGLISATTMPSGGTSDYAPEMIHAAAKGEPYACFVRPDTTIPFMAMPDASDALLQAGGGAARAADADGLQRRRVQPVGGRDPRGRARGVSAAREITYKIDEKRQGIVDSWPADVDDSAARDRLGLSARLRFRPRVPRIPHPDHQQLLPLMTSVTAFAPATVSNVALRVRRARLRARRRRATR